MTNAEKYLQDIADKLNASEVKAGFYSGRTYTDGTSVAMVATRNEYGDPANNQPPRPFFRNAIANKQEEWKNSLSRGLAAGVDAKNVLEVVGDQIKGDIQESISELMEPALSPVTIHRRRTRKERKNDSTKPLVDTGEMFSDVNYEVT